MAPPRASQNFQQRQPITTTLRTICQSYPSNTCLRELLQNADDAGATEIEYVLDTESYSDGPFLHDGLLEYHGPALLARNNKIFRDEDFSSLSSVGDSGKRGDPESTGKFGQGFNSVYHWTDGPWVYSRNWLLLLDPHARWSSETGKPGGPTWDVVENHRCLEIQNHLKAFKAFDVDHSQIFNETIIRIPLRTNAQAETSEIVKRAVSTKEIKEALLQFGQEMEEGGLLFLKHVRKVIIRVDSTTISTTQVLEEESQDTRARNELSADFRGLYASNETQSAKDVSKIFEVKIRHTNQAFTKTDKYLVHHTMTKSFGDIELDDWARDLKLFPWVAVAAPLRDLSREEQFPGRLFTTLRLPILTNQPVHIHGLFAIAPDRTRLGFDNLAVKWNNLMFKNRISRAWAKLLVHRSTASSTLEGFGLWPRTDISHSDLWAQLDMWIIELMIKKNLPVWNAINGRCVRFDEGLFSKLDSESEKYASPLARIQLPAVMLEETLFQKVQKQGSHLAKKLNLMTPTAVRSFLRSVPAVPQEEASFIMEYCLLDAIHSDFIGPPRTTLYSDLNALAFWPTLEGTLAVSNTCDLLLPRSHAEMTMFSSSRSSKTLDILKITPKVRELLWKDAAYLGSVMRFRTLRDLAKDWPTMYPLAAQPTQLSGSIPRPQDLDPTVREAWTWIYARTQEEQGKIPPLLHDLWLVPLKNNRVRKLGPGKNSAPTLIIEKGEPLAEFLIGATSYAPVGTSPLLDSESLPSEAVRLLRQSASTGADLHFACQDNLDLFVDWLVEGKNLLPVASSRNKEAVLSHLEKLVVAQSHLKQPSAKLTSQIRKLPLFRKMSSVAPFREWTYTECGLDRVGHLYRRPLNLPPLPDISGILFYDISIFREEYLVRQLKLLEEISLEQMLTEHLLPWMATALHPSLIPAKDALVEYIFDNSETPTASWKLNIMSQPIVPLPLCEGLRLYRCLKDLVDPTSMFSQLYFREENVFPCSDFLERHKVALIACGLSNGVSLSTPFERARYYSEHSTDVQGLGEKVKCLFKVSIQPELYTAVASVEDFRARQWLPGSSISGEPLLLSPNTCRDAERSHLVDMVWGKFDQPVPDDWRTLLGWDQPVPKEVLLQQLDRCLERNDYEKVDKVLTEIKPEDFPELSSKPCILVRHRRYMVPKRVFYPGSHLHVHSLAPYLEEIDGYFATKHVKLLVALGIKPEPSVEDLQYVQKALDASRQGRLSESDLSIAISTLEIATLLRFDTDNFLVPDTTSILRSLVDIVHGDWDAAGHVKFNFTHAKLSMDLINRLGIENSLARATRLEIEIEDEDEDEFTPRERLSTIICDTLGRYPIETTFNEFLANADDAGATRISWIIDECHDGPYESGSVLSPELKPFQGPALTVFNDGIFSEKDFAGFKEIGQGGKTDDATTTGMFGRGALSMYHFTDVPMIISGSFYLVLDPQQECLPRNKHYKHKTGVKISLKTARRIAGDQLLPFHGLYGFDKDLDNYDGTIFRFPFRNLGSKTTLKDTAKHMDSRTTKDLLEAYFDTARISLLFLHSVTEIEFRIRGEENPLWSVTAHRSESSDDEVFQQITIANTKEKCEPTTDVWRIGVTDIENSPAGIVKVGKSSSKITECGIAACLQQGKLIQKQGVKVEDSEVSQVQDLIGQRKTPIVQKVFCKLPTTSQSQLPVSFHASFAITGDRKTIVFEENNEISAWNYWLLTECVSHFYLDFLKDLSPRLGEETFRFWPSKLGAGSLRTLSGTVAKAFWDKVMDREHITYQLYPTVNLEIPAIVQGSNDLRRTKARKTRKLHGVTSLGNARFDFLTQNVSAKLRPLFLLLGINLVRPSQPIWEDLKNTASGRQMADLNAAFLAELFQQETHCQTLETFLARLGKESKKADVVATLLELVVPLTDGNDFTPLNILHGCRIIPKPSLDAPMGLLTLEPQNISQLQLVATPEEQKLFEFASESMVNTTLFPRLTGKLETLSEKTRDPIAEIMKAQFNVRKFEVDVVGTLLALPQSPTATTKSSDSQDEWVCKMWAYLNNKFRTLKYAGDFTLDAKPLTLEDLITKAGIWDKAVYRCRTNEKWQYITPRQFTAGPFIVAPEHEPQQELCARIPGLKCLDRSCLPSLLVNDEKDLVETSSFQRFLRALSKIGNVKNTLSASLTMEARKTLRGLLIFFLRAFSQSDTIPDISLLQALPVWPCVKNSVFLGPPVHIAAEDAHFCKHSKMFMPWIKDLTTFVDPQVVLSEEKSLLKLDIKLKTAENFWDYIKQDLPKAVDSEVSRKQYIQLVQYLASHSINPSGKIAPNGDGELCRADSLYNYDDEIFNAAFRAEESKSFLHPDLRIPSLRSFWLTAGLRARTATKVMSSADYVQCALAVGRQWMTPGRNLFFDPDAKTVTAHLQFDRPEFHEWPLSTWEVIAKAPMFHVKDNVSNQRLYRQARMLQLSQENTHCALQDAGRPNDERILWSQVKFLKYPPASAVFEKLPRGHSPSILVVYQHLQFLICLCGEISQRDSEEYLKDIQACYNCLQENADVTKQLPGIREAKVWFNVDTTQIDVISKEDLQANITSSDFLCLNSLVDPLPTKVARKFLVPYERLLKALGCKTVIQPATLAPKPPGKDVYPMAGPLTEIRVFRDQSQLTDVIFTASGHEKHAHRIFLAAVSGYCKAQFLGEWGRLLERQATIHIEDMTFSTLSTMVDFAYTGEFASPQLKDLSDGGKISDILDDLLALLDATDMWLLDRLHDLVEDFLLTPPHSSIYIRADNVEGVRERADGARAFRLSKHCENFAQANKEFVEAFRDRRVADEEEELDDIE